MSRGIKNIKWYYNVGDIIQTDRQDFILTNKEIRDKIKKSKTSTSGFCHEYQKWYEYTCKKCGTENLWMQENAIKNNCGCPVCNRISQTSVAPWLYEIGQKLVDDKRDLIITDKKIVEREQASKTCISGSTIHKEKYYKYHCNKCGYNDGWKVESALKSGQGCSCCCIPCKIVVPGINDIPTTDPWMIPYFQGGEEEAKLYSKGSSEKLFFKCPDCGKIKNKQMCVSTVYNMKGISCECSDKTSYPEKFFSSFLNQLHIPFERQFTFKGSRFRYDFVVYSLKQNRLVFIETDGGLGHGESTWNKDIQDSRNSLMRDLDKTILALSYGIPVIKVDCFHSDKSYISNNIINNEELKKYIDFDINKIDWDECDKFAMKNIVKTVCLEYNEKSDIDYLSKKYKIHPQTIKKYIRKGEEYGWTNKINESCRRKNKHIAIYKNDKLILVHEKISALCKDSEKLLGVNLKANGIYAVCIGTKKKYKEYVFKYISKEEYDILFEQLNKSKL